MSASSRQKKAREIRRLLETEGESVARNTRGFNQGRYESTRSLDNYEDLKSRARSIKERAIDQLPDLIDELERSVQANGGNVYRARDAGDANDYIRRVVQQRNGQVVVKSKSMTTEEIELNDSLRNINVDVWETDLGEFVLQVADEAPSHLVAPAIHKSPEAIADLFRHHFNLERSLETPEQLTQFAREELHRHIRQADVGITGANFLVADTGSLALVTSEGNARKSVACSDVHIAVAGVEKILPRFEDLHPFVELIARSGTGQDLTSYVSLFTPPSPSPLIRFDRPDQPIATGSRDDREFHLVLLDNGRMEMRDDPQLRETLYCIRCGACANSCANFQSVGGHAFGGETYTGGIATGWETGIYGLESAAEFNDLCTGCSRCVTACPVKIDIPWINNVVRDRINRKDHSTPLDFLVEGLVPDEEPGGIDLQKRLFGNFEWLARWGSRTAPWSNWMATSRLGRALLEHLFGVDPRRDLPTFQRETLTRWFKNRTDDQVSYAKRELVLFPDLFTNHVHVERGQSAVRMLERTGNIVEMASAMETGRAPLSQGMIETATENARRVYQELEPYLNEGRDVVVVEPSDLAMFRSDYEKLLPRKQYERLRDHSYELIEYLHRVFTSEDGIKPDRFRQGEGRTLSYHAHCQQRTLDLEQPTRELLESAGYEVHGTGVECCGMAGSFGYKSEYYELSIDVGDHLHQQIQEHPNGDRLVTASGTSCQEQLQHMLNQPVLHPIEVLDPLHSVPEA